jgi:hypothetical protein
MPRGPLRKFGDESRRLTIRMRESEWTYFEEKARGECLDWDEKVQRLVAEQIAFWRRRDWARQHPEGAAAYEGVHTGGAFHLEPRG